MIGRGELGEYKKRNIRREEWAFGSTLFLLGYGVKKFSKKFQKFKNLKKKFSKKFFKKFFKSISTHIWCELKLKKFLFAICKFTCGFAMRFGVANPM